MRILTDIQKLESQNAHLSVCLTNTMLEVVKLTEENKDLVETNINLTRACKENASWFDACNEERETYQRVLVVFSKCSDPTLADIAKTALNKFKD